MAHRAIKDRRVPDVRYGPYQFPINLIYITRPEAKAEPGPWPGPDLDLGPLASVSVWYTSALGVPPRPQYTWFTEV